MIPAASSTPARSFIEKRFDRENLLLSIQLLQMKLFKQLILLLAIAALPVLSYAQTDSAYYNSNPPQQKKQQQKQKPPLSQRIYVGGNLGFYFGNTTYIAVSPIVGYRFTENFTAGVGGTYQYWKDNYNNYPASNVYGGLLFGRYNIYKGLFLETDLEFNNLDAYSIDQNGNLYSSRQWVTSWLVGGGYSGGGSRGGAYFSVLYDVIQDPNSPYYGVPVIRAGVGFGL